MAILYHILLISLLCSAQQSLAQTTPSTSPSTTTPEESTTLEIKQDLFPDLDPSTPGAASLATFGYKCRLALSNKDIPAIIDIVNNTTDSFLTSIGKAPTVFLKDSLNSNMKLLTDSKLPDDLKESAQKHLNSMYDDYNLHMGFDIGNATQGIGNYKTVLAPITNENMNKEKVLLQAPLIFTALDKLLHELSRHLQEMVGTAVNAFYAITMDTITNHYENWEKTANNETVWIDPDFNHHEYYLQNSQYGYIYRGQPAYMPPPLPPNAYLPIGPIPAYAPPMPGLPQAPSAYGPTMPRLPQSPVLTAAPPAGPQIYGR